MNNNTEENAPISVVGLAGKLACQIPKYLVLDSIYINTDWNGIFFCLQYLIVIEDV